MNRRNFLKLTSMAGISFYSGIFPNFEEKEEIKEEKKKLSKLERKLYSPYLEVETKFKPEKNKKILILDGPSQKMYLVYGYPNFKIDKTYGVSTSKNGFGNKNNSWKTPTGIHKISGIYGKGAKEGLIFKSRWKTGGITKIYEDKSKTNGYMTTRLITLEGCEEKNKNTLERGIYIHGTSAEGSIGRPLSHGCIRMKNKDVIELSNLVEIGTYVNIISGKEDI